MFFKKDDLKESKNKGDDSLMVTKQREKDTVVSSSNDSTHAIEPPSSSNHGEERNTRTDLANNEFDGKVIEAISTVFDPEIPVNIYELGLIYNIDVNAMKDVHIDMTLTSPACPVAGTLPGDVERVVKEVEGIGGVCVELVWEPAWSPDRMSEAAKLELGFM